MAVVAEERSGLHPDPDPDGRTWAGRLAFWRPPAGQPPWARPVLLGIAGLAAVLYGWNLSRAGLAPFYSTAVKSMSESWKAFFYGAFDPQATITIDKLAGSFLPQALSARIFGYHPWSLALPQVIEGVVSVLAMYRIGRRWAGTVPGLLAAGIFALTPIAASMFGHSMEDGALTMCLVLAADSFQRAVLEGRPRSLVWSGVWVGLGFQAKMLQAWIILPALALGYLVAAPGGLRRRLAHLGVASLAMLAVSLSWIALYTVTPASSRPYVDGSTSDSAFSMVFGYNGLERFGVTVAGSVNSGPGVGSRSGGSAPAIRSGSVSGTGSGARTGTTTLGPRGGFTGDSGGWTKLISSRFGPEIGWLYPLALLALAFGLWSRRRARRADPVRGGFIMWGTWLLTFGVIYSVMTTIPHTAYLASLAPPLAALSGAGIVAFWNWYRSASALWWLLPAAIVAEVAWAAYLWSSYGSFLPWALWLVLGSGLAAAAGLVALRLLHPAQTVRLAGIAPPLPPAQSGPAPIGAAETDPVLAWQPASAPASPSGAGSGRRGWAVSGRLVTATLAVGVAAMLAAPATWALSVLDSRYAGSSFDAAAGPAGGAGGPGGTLASGSSRLGAFGGFGALEEYAKSHDLRLPAGPGGAPGGGVPAGAGAPGGGLPGGGLPGAGGTGTGAMASGNGGAGAGMLGTTETLTAAEQRIYNYVSARRGNASYLMAVQSWHIASPYIVATGQEVLPLGGFSGSVPSPTLARFKELVSTGQLKFVLLGGGAGEMGGQGGGTASQAQRIAAWAASSCSAIPAADTGSSSGTLYRCGA